MQKYICSVFIIVLLSLGIAFGQDSQLFTYKLLPTDDPQNKSVVEFSANLPAGANFVSWDFGDGNNSNQLHPEKAYAYTPTTNEKFTVTVTYSVAGELLTAEQEINVNPAFFHVVTDFQLGELASLKRIFRSAFMFAENDTSLLGDMRFRWTFTGFEHSNYSFTDGAYFDYPNAYHTFENGGSYTITLEVHNITNPLNIAQYTRSITLDPDFSAGKLDFTNLPNVITPNNDGVNDFFKVETSGTSRLSFKVFSRGGAVVYETEASIIKWDGKNYYGTTLPDGIYYYVLVDLDGKYNTASGFFYIYN